ncbi:MAG: hypothetical protein V1756_00180 [Patescibacteria group bacterium]
MCSKCGKIFCFGHYESHRREEHNLCYLCDETLPCPQHSEGFKRREPVTLEGFKVCCISEEFSDEQLDTLMGMLILEFEEDVVEFCAILHKYRPALEKKFAENLKKKQSGR